MIYLSKKNQLPFPRERGNPVVKGWTILFRGIAVLAERLDVGNVVGRERIADRNNMIPSEACAYPTAYAAVVELGAKRNPFQFGMVSGKAAMPSHSFNPSVLPVLDHSGLVRRSPCSRSLLGFFSPFLFSRALSFLFSSWSEFQNRVISLIRLFIVHLFVGSVSGFHSADDLSTFFKMAVCEVCLVGFIPFRYTSFALGFTPTLQMIVDGEVVNRKFILALGAGFTNHASVSFRTLARDRGIHGRPSFFGTTGTGPSTWVGPSQEVYA